MGAPRRSKAVAELAEFPRELDRYTLLGELASGGMAKVYVGRQVGAAGFERIVAIKCCHEHLRGNEAFADMFLQEARLAARIRHHNVVATLDVSDGNPLYLVMEYVEGCSLSVLARAARRRGQRVPLDVSLRVVCDALAGLHAAHECPGPEGELLGLVHCDVSPQNVLVGVDGSARITDFGIARATARMTLEDQSVIKGKPSYMAPEQLGSGDVSPRTDVYAAAVVLWELLTGQSLFKAADDWATMHAVLTRPVPTPSSVEPSVPPALDAVLLRALARDPAERHRSAGDLLAAIERLPLTIATARRVGEYVRAEAGDCVPPGPFPSGRYPRGTASSPALADDVPGRQALVESHTRPVDLPTRLFEPPPELVAATRQPSAPDAERARRMVVAIVLILVGLACGFLFTRGPAREPKPTPALAPAHP